MEKTESQQIAEIIDNGTQKIAEASGKKYKPIEFEQEKQPTEEERQQLSDKVVGQIKEGEKEEEKKMAEHVKMFGEKPKNVFW
ncbi:hypothetical protein [Prolixibacter denitrificans]|uniref:Uncharacterized protein n=1 Tax=Prolixibacter denitrificans TaxID=1541063 RepID=A0A2P8CJX5_9BACT|nr:hypothetical protein [Prolixibacter denitrificans]PSK85261.1 hypothetical protein CLV93_101213 [Prolixibacter denitrificans]GET19883.1 hypothetical protein JCM18694_01290 [Prolixibacter denitrificans]